LILSEKRYCPRTRLTAIAVWQNLGETRPSELCNAVSRKCADGSRGSAAAEAIAASLNGKAQKP
jgi:hypothetical protein